MTLAVRDDDEPTDDGRDEGSGLDEDDAGCADETNGRCCHQGDQFLDGDAPPRRSLLEDRSSRSLDLGTLSERTDETGPLDPKRPRISELPAASSSERGMLLHLKSPNALPGPMPSRTPPSNLPIATGCWTSGG